MHNDSHHDRYCDGYYAPLASPRRPMAAVTAAFLVALAIGWVCNFIGDCLDAIHRYAAQWDSSELKIAGVLIAVAAGIVIRRKLAHDR